MDKINLVKNTIDNHDIDRLIDWLKGYPRLTKGELNLEFEKKFANWMGRKYAIFCNSGSSANLLMFKTCIAEPCSDTGNQITKNLILD